MGLTGVCSRLVGDIVQAIRAAAAAAAPPPSASPSPSPSSCLDHHPTPTMSMSIAAPAQVDGDLMIRALTAVFGMEANGKIKKEKARHVVEKLGLMYGADHGENQSSFELPNGVDDEDELPVEEVLGGLEYERHQLLQEAFRIFDEDGNGYIEAVELKRVLQCLGLDKGMDMTEIEKMLKAVDLNLDGKVDFSEFELMMG